MTANSDADASEDGEGSNGAVEMKMLSQCLDSGAEMNSQAEREEINAGFNRRGAFR